MPSLGLKDKQVHAVIIKNNDEQLKFIKSILSKSYQDINVDNKDIEIIYKEPNLVDNLSIAENLYFEDLPKIKYLPLINWGELKKKSVEIKDKYNIDFHYKQKVDELSTESKKLISILKHFSKEPKIIIMQEPMEYISVEYVIKINRMIRDFINNGGRIIYITKQWEEALSISNWITVISKGEISGGMSANDAKSNPRKLLSLIEEYHYVEDLDRENNVLSTVFKSAEFLTSEYELKDILMLLAKELTEAMGVEGCSINLIDSPTSTIIDNYIYSKSMTELPKLKDEFILDTASQKDIYYSNINDIEFESIFDEVTDIKTIICIPILIRTQLSGLISIFYKDNYIQTQEETMYLVTFARHVAIAIEDTRLMGRSALLQESHHRIKNNLQSIISLVMMQKSYIDVNNKKSIEDVFEKIVYSIMSIASVHDLLSRNEHGGSIVNLKEIIETLISTIGYTDIIFNLDLEDVFISYSKATSVAIVVNELLSNTEKHAFISLPREYERKVDIKLSINKDDIILIVNDNGIGISEDFDFNDLTSVGLTIINGIVKSEFQGDISFVRNNGTTVTIIVSRKWMI